MRLITVSSFLPKLNPPPRLGNTVLVSYRTLDSSRLCRKHLEWHSRRGRCRFLVVSPCYAVTREFHRSVGTADTPMFSRHRRGFAGWVCFYVSQRHGGWFSARRRLPATSTLSPPSSQLKTTPPLIHIVPHMWGPDGWTHATQIIDVDSSWEWKIQQIEKCNRIIIGVVCCLPHNGLRLFIFKGCLDFFPAIRILTIHFLH